MYTSKHTSLSPNQFMRPQRDHSPSHKHTSKGSKFYSSEEVSRMIKSYIQPKIHYLKNELQQKQKIIQVLNQKLDQNDSHLRKIYHYAENMAKHIKQPELNNNVVPIINQILNDKLKAYWQTVNGHIEQIKEAFQEGSFIDSKKLQAKIQMELQNIRKYTTEYVEASRVKNNNYWLKIKEALNRINSKLMKVDETLQKTNENLDNFRQQSHYAHEHINQLQKSRGVIKKLTELKKSVSNIYHNYQSVLQLQDQYKNRLTESNLRNRVSNQDSNDLIDFNQVRENEHPQQGGNTFPMFRKKPTNFIDQIKHTESQNQFFQPTYKKNNYHEKDSYQFPDDNFALEYSKEQNGSQIFHAPMTSKSTAKDSQKNVFSTKYYVPNVPSTHKKSTTTFVLGQSPIKNPSESGKWEQGMSSPNQLSCLNSSSNALRHGASRSTSFVNLSLQNRNQMSESVKQRLQQIIELKNLSKPLLVYLDEINYLKNNEGNYIFDTRGNMFKVNVEEGKQLERLGLIKFIQKGRDQSSGKKSSLAFGNSIANQQALSRGKTINVSNSKVKSISIKQTVI